MTEFEQWNPDARNHATVKKWVIEYLLRLGFTITENNNVLDKYKGAELLRIQTTYDDLEILKMRSLPDIRATFTNGLVFDIDVKTGHFLEAFQLAFNIERVFAGEPMIYVVANLAQKKMKVLQLGGLIFDQIRPPILYHPERPWHLDFLKRSLKIGRDYQFPEGHNVGNGRSQDPCVCLEDDVYDELPEFETWVLDTLTWGIKQQ